MPVRAGTLKTVMHETEEEQVSPGGPRTSAGIWHLTTGRDWRISMAHRSNAHRNAQRMGRERDYNTCQICGSTHSVEGHHIFDYSMGGAAHMDNIVSLCHDCHRKVHEGRIDIDVF